MGALVTYFVLIGQRENGPYLAADLFRLIRNGTVDWRTPCSKPGDSEWVPLELIRQEINDRPQYASETGRPPVPITDARYTPYWILVGVLFLLIFGGALLSQFSTSEILTVAGFLGSVLVLLWCTMVFRCLRSIDRRLANLSDVLKARSQ